MSNLSSFCMHRYFRVLFSRVSMRYRCFRHIRSGSKSEITFTHSSQHFWGSLIPIILHRNNVAWWSEKSTRINSCQNAKCWSAYINVISFVVGRRFGVRTCVNRLYIIMYTIQVYCRPFVPNQVEHKVEAKRPNSVAFVQVISARQKFWWAARRNLFILLLFHACIGSFTYLV